MIRTLLICTLILWSTIKGAVCLNIPHIGYRPVVIWHGLGDSYDSPGMVRVEEIIQDMYPGIYTHNVYLDESGSTDQRKSFFGNINDELEFVCKQLADIPELEGGFDALGFSQGGLFLRAYAERCNVPQLRQLISFGSPHNGIADLPTCGLRDFLCRRRNAILKTQVWSSYAQHNVISAQYYRDPEKLDDYLEYSNFLADINNEREDKNQTYAENLKTLERLVMISFSEDETVVPKESAWFQEVNVTSGKVTPLEYRDLYKEDWLGLKQLGASEKIEYLRIKGVHMEVSDDDIKSIAEKYLGSTQLPRLIHQSP